MSRRATTLICCLAAAATASACGSTGNGQTKGTGTYRVDATASFPSDQHLNRDAVLEVKVRNAGDRPVPDVAVSVTSAKGGTSAPAFAMPSNQQGLAERFKPVWILDEQPTGGQTAMANTWTLGELQAGAEKTFTWRVHPVKRGSYTIRWKVAPAMEGGKAELTAGGPAEGDLPVTISDQAPAATVSESGRVVNTP